MNIGEESRKEVGKDRRMILREEKESNGSKKNSGRKKSVEGSNSKDWVVKDRYIEENYGGGITR